MLARDTLTGLLHEVPDELLGELAGYDAPGGLGLPIAPLIAAAAPLVGGLLKGGGGGRGGGGSPAGGGGGGGGPVFIPIPSPPQIIPIPIPVPYPAVRVPVPWFGRGAGPPDAFSPRAVGPQGQPLSPTGRRVRRRRR